MHTVHIKYKKQSITYVSRTPIADKNIALWAIEARSIKLMPVHGIGPSETRLHRIGAYDWTIDVFIDYWLAGRQADPITPAIIEDVRDQYREAAQHAHKSYQTALADKADQRQADTLYRAYRAFSEAARHADLATPIRQAGRRQTVPRQTPMLVNTGMDSIGNSAGKRAY
jgi:hypothetical protein